MAKHELKQLLLISLDVRPLPQQPGVQFLFEKMSVRLTVMVPAQAYENPIKRLCAETKLHDRERNVTVRGPNQRAEGKEKARDAGNQSAVLTDRSVLCLSVCCGALSDCVYFPEGRFTSGSLGMNGELISPTESSQSLGIYSPLSQ